MLPPIRYLDFAGRWYGQVDFDLASSGIAPVAPELLGGPPRLDDLTARDRFRAAVAERYGVPTSEVVPCLGASGALFVAHTTWLAPGDRLLVESPSYEPLWRAADALGRPVDRFERRFDSAFALDTDEIVGALRPETRLVAITNPHNPSGLVVSDEQVLRLATALAERDVTLLIDEAYRELSAPRETARSLAANVITCSSATKCWGAGWTRAGWLLCPEARAADAARVERYVAGLAPPSAWALGELALANADTLLERAHALQRGKRARVDAFLAAERDTLDWQPPPESAVFGWVRDRRGEDLLPRIERGIRELGVIVAPGLFFGEPSAFRLGWTTAADQIAPGLDRLARALGLAAGAAP